MKMLTQEQFLSNIFIIIISLFNLMTGVFFLLVNPDITSPTYIEMGKLMPLPIYGACMVLSALLMMLGVFLDHSSRNVLFIVGGLLGGIFLGLYSSASTIGGVNAMMPLRYALISLSGFAIALSGGFELWQMRKNI